jgi:hypothetical protein
MASNSLDVFALFINRINSFIFPFSIISYSLLNAKDYKVGLCEFPKYLYQHTLSRVRNPLPLLSKFQVSASRRIAELDHLAIRLLDKFQAFALLRI